MSTPSSPASDKPNLRLIQGGGEQLSEWLSPPKTVVGRSPFKKDAIMAYRVAAGDLRKHIQVGRRQPIMDLWWHVYGELPPLPGASRFGSELERQSVGLHSARACFRGIMRPVGEDDQGLDHVAFVSKPTVGFKYKPSMSCLLEPYSIPSDLVFVIYARLDFPGRPGLSIEKW